METSTSLHEFSKNNNSISIANITSSDGTPNYQSTSINFQTNNTERKIVVLSPGSYSIKLGFAQPLPLEPFTIRNVIARRTKQSNNISNIEASFPALSEKDNQLKEAVLSQMKEDKQIKPLLDQLKIKLKKQNAIFDSENSVKTFPSDNEKYWTDVTSNPEFLVGEEALRISPSEPYEIIFPLHRGYLNISPQHSLRRIVEELETILLFAIESKLNLKKSDLKNCDVVLVIPDKFDKITVIELMRILLIHFEFHSAFVHQESVCASFGSGLGTACIIDIGYHHTTISCIEEGISLSRARAQLKFGGGNILELLIWLLKRPDSKHYFPYPNCDLNRIQDQLIFNELKENLCHFPNDKLDIATFQFTVRHPSDGSTQYIQMNVSDVLILSPMGLFYPQIFQPISNYQPTKEHILEDNEYTTIHDEKSNTFQKEELEKSSYGIDSFVHPSNLNSLDEVVFNSIENLRQELKKKLYSNIVFVGGTAKFDNLTDIFEERISRLIPPLLGLEVSIKKKDTDPRFTSWKGAAIFCALESTKELFIKSSEWKEFGSSLLKERALFHW